MTSTRYPTPEERARIMERRRALLVVLTSIDFRLRRAEQPHIIDRLKRKYGADEVERMLTISEELTGRIGRSPYERYLELYRRFGKDRRLLSSGEHADLSAERAQLEQYAQSDDVPLTPAQRERLVELTNLLMSDWPFWEDLMSENPPAEIPDIQITHDYPSPLDEILTWGKHGNLRTMLRKLESPEKYISDLIRMALDLELLWAPSDAPKVYAPTHAVRLLGMLGAEEAAGPLLELLDLDQDWVADELPHVYAGIGPAAIPHLHRYLADPEQDRYGRIQAAHALQEVTAAHPAERERVVDILREQLRRHQADRGLNGFLISYLLDLRAKEALNDIKAAYLADKVDRQVVGNYDDVLAEFGLPPDPEVPSRPIHADSPLKAIFDRMLGDVLAPKSEPPQRREKGESKGTEKNERQTRKRRRRRREKK